MYLLLIHMPYRGPGIKRLPFPLLHDCDHYEVIFYNETKKSASSRLQSMLHLMVWSCLEHICSLFSRPCDIFSPPCFSAILIQHGSNFLHHFSSVFFGYIVKGSVALLNYSTVAWPLEQGESSQRWGDFLVLEKEKVDVENKSLHSQNLLAASKEDTRG